MGKRANNRMNSAKKKIGERSKLRGKGRQKRPLSLPTEYIYLSLTKEPSSKPTDRFTELSFLSIIFCTRSKCKFSLAAPIHFLEK